MSQALAEQSDPTQPPTTPVPNAEPELISLPDHILIVLNLLITQIELYWSQAETQEKLLTVQYVIFFILSVAAVIIWNRTKPKLIEFQRYQRIEQTAARLKKKT